jgi:hypothetical protein
VKKSKFKGLAKQKTNKYLPGRAEAGWMGRGSDFMVSE